MGGSLFGDSDQVTRISKISRVRERAIMRIVRNTLILGLPLVLAAASQAAITVTNVSVVGASIVNQGYLGNNGYTIVFDAANSAAKGNGASKQLTVTYNITSTKSLVGYQFSPLGTVFRGDVNATIKHNAITDAYAWSSPLTATGVSSLSQPPHKALSGLFAYAVTATIDLSTLSANPRNRVGIGALTQYNISYNTGVDAVPEPASLAALALGGLAFVRRRKGNR